MNVLLWIVQVVLALHTVAGALFKFSHSPEQTMPALKVIPPGAWTGMSVAELLCALALLLPAFNKRLAILIPLAVTYIAAEMVLFSVLHLHSGAAAYGPMVYWLVIAAVCAFVAYGRLSLRPLRGTHHHPAAGDARPGALLAGD
jgi:hypothetical protein